MDTYNAEIISFDNYVKTIETLLNNGYIFVKFQDNISNLIKEGVPFVILRHDVDFSLRGAVRIATIEDNLGVRATYFFHLRSPLYNLFSEYASLSLAQIKKMEHDICLHFDIGLYEDEYQGSLLDELNIFKKFYPFCNPQIISFHRVGKRASSLKDLRMPNDIIHTYQEVFFNTIAYYSDSGGQWRHGNPLESDDFSRRKPMQLVTHPMWWTEDGIDPYNKLDSYLRNNREQTIDFLENTVISYSLNSIRKVHE